MIGNLLGSIGDVFRGIAIGALSASEATKQMSGAINAMGVSAKEAEAALRGHFRYPLFNRGKKDSLFAYKIDSIFIRDPKMKSPYMSMDGRLRTDLNKVKTTTSGYTTTSITSSTASTL